MAAVLFREHGSRHRAHVGAMYLLVGEYPLEGGTGEQAMHCDPGGKRYRGGGGGDWEVSDEGAGGQGDR